MVHAVLGGVLMALALERASGLRLVALCREMLRSTRLTTGGHVDRAARTRLYERLIEEFS
jgi:hypothetical protein